jgi:hypothetical protein
MQNSVASPPVAENQTPGGSLRTTVAQQWILYIASGLVFIMGIFLYLLSDNTQTFFAWTIGVPLTAAFLGGGYWASFILEFLAARERTWANSRIAVPAVLMFTSLTFITTLLHLDKFHLNVPEIITLVLTWAWIIVYAVVPFTMGFIWIQQMRAPGHDPARQHALPGWFRATLGIQAVVLIALGAGLFLMPDNFASLWAWELTPLTARAIGAWLIGIGIGAGQAVVENDWIRIRPLMIAYAVYGILQVINLLRYPTAAGLDWSNLKTWLYVIFMASILLAGGYGSWIAQRAYQAQP